ncbi:MAG: DHCW motif cupin fold protein [Saprospiraceae bacterium]
MEIPFTLIDWSQLESIKKTGKTGNSIQHSVEYPGLRVRIVEYSSGYLSDHWCKKGHIVHCLEGGFESEMETGEKYQLSKGMTYIVSDKMSTHRSNTEHGTKLLIIDGDFLKM